MALALKLCPMSRDEPETVASTPSEHPGWLAMLAALDRMVYPCQAASTALLRELVTTHKPRDANAELRASAALLWGSLGTYSHPPRWDCDGCTRTDQGAEWPNECRTTGIVARFLDVRL